MATDEFGQALLNEIGAALQGPAQHRRCECVIDQCFRAGFGAQFDQGIEDNEQVVEKFKDFLDDVSPEDFMQDS